MMPRSLRPRLLLAFLALAVLPLLLGGGLLAWESYQTYVREVQTRQRDLAERLAAEVAGFFREVEVRLRALDLARDFANLDAEAQGRELSLLLAERRDFRSLALLDALGRERARVSAIDPVLAGDLRLRGQAEEFRRPVESGHSYAGPIRYDRETGEPLMTYSVPLADPASGRVAAVLVADLRVKRLWELAAGRGLPPGQSLAVLDGRQRIIAHHNPSVVLRETRLAATPAEGRGQGLEGQPAYLAVRDLTVAGQTFTAVAEYGVSHALQPARRSLAVIMGATLLALSLVLALAWLAIRRIVLPVEAISAAAQAIRNGDLGRRAEVVGDDEIGELAQSFNAMTADLRAALDRQQKAMAEVEDLYDRAPCGYHSLGPDGSFLRVNDTELAWLGYGREELVGRRKFADILTEESRQVFLDHFPRFKSEGFAHGVEFDMRRKDGSILAVLVSATAITDADGNFLMSRSTLYDITARREAEAALRESEARLVAAQQAANQELERRVAERTAELEASNRELEAFAYSVSHDLRTPLRAIDGFSQMLIEDYGDRLDDEGRRLLGVVRQGTGRMSQLIDDLLDFSRVGRQEMAAVGIDMDRLAREVVDEVMLVAPGRQIRFDIKPLPTAWGDRAMLRQVLVNLLGNAVKFTRGRSDATIEVGGHVEAEENRYYVKDNGVGFAMEYADKLFGVFRRLHSAQEFEGTGIGLAIVKRVVSRHGGQVSAEGRLGEGATISFSLPRRGADR